MPATISTTKPARADGDAMAVFKRHFETQFAPLGGSAVAKTKTKQKKQKKVDTACEAEWTGLPDADAPPQVVEFASQDPLAGSTKPAKRVLKSFMSSRPPSDAAVPAPAPTAAGEEDEEDPAAETALLKNDLALQRLLRESHLLDTTLAASGRNRLKALESRVQALGGRDITVQKHPMAVRRGMDAARRLKEEKRRRHAKEAGIVLEREVRVRKVGEREKTRGRGFGPSVGRFRNGTLVLSKRDVMDIEGRTGGGGRGGKGGKGQRGGRGGRGGKGAKKRG